MERISRSVLDAHYTQAARAEDYYPIAAHQSGLSCLRRATAMQLKRANKMFERSDSRNMRSYYDKKSGLLPDSQAKQSICPLSKRVSHSKAD